MYRKDLYNPDDYKQGSGTVSQCFSCANRKCSRFKMIKNNLDGIEPAKDNSGVILNSKFCNSGKDKYNDKD